MKKATRLVVAVAAVMLVLGLIAGDASAQWCGPYVPVVCGPVVPVCGPFVAVCAPVVVAPPCPPLFCAPAPVFFAPRPVRVYRAWCW